MGIERLLTHLVPLGGYSSDFDPGTGDAYEHVFHKRYTRGAHDSKTCVEGNCKCLMLSFKLR